MKIICIVQRYGMEIIGGAEYHCRLIARMLSKDHSVEIVSTCAKNYISWENELPEGSEEIDGIIVHRFPVESSRPADFEALAYRTLYGTPSKSEQLVFIQAQGPYAPKIIDYLGDRTDTDLFIFFSYRYWITYEGILRFGKKSILVPTAEHDRSIYLSSYRDVFLNAAVIAFNSAEERDIIEQTTGHCGYRGEIVGVGLEEGPVDFRRDITTQYDLFSPYIIYLGRIERAKGCACMIDSFLNAFHHNGQGSFPDLVLAGKQDMAIPEHSKLRSLGVIPESDKNALIHNALCLVMPSRYESLSMVVLEAWKNKKAVLCNGDCEVLRGQCLRSGGGIYYRSNDEFAEGLDLLIRREDLRACLGEQGHRYYLSHYSWDIIRKKYETMLKEVAI